MNAKELEIDQQQINAISVLNLRILRSNLAATDHSDVALSSVHLLLVVIMLLHPEALSLQGTFRLVGNAARNLVAGHTDLTDDTGPAGGTDPSLAVQI